MLRLETFEGDWIWVNPRYVIMLNPTVRDGREMTCMSLENVREPVILYEHPDTIFCKIRDSNIK